VAALEYLTEERRMNKNVQQVKVLGCEGEMYSYSTHTVINIISITVTVGLLKILWYVIKYLKRVYMTSLYHEVEMNPT